MRDSAGAPLGALSISARAESIDIETKTRIVAILNKESRVLQNLIHQANIDVAEYSKRFSENQFV